MECVNFTGPIPYPAAGLPEQPIPPGVDWQRGQGTAPERPFNRELFAHWTEGLDHWWGSWRSYSNGQLTGLGSHAFDMVQYGARRGRFGTGGVLARGVGSASKSALPLRQRNRSAIAIPEIKLHIAARETVPFLSGKSARSRSIATSSPPILAIRRGPADPKLAEKWEGDGWVAQGHIENWFDCIKSRAVPTPTSRSAIAR